MMARTEFNRAANDSPRSGSSKLVTPLVWCVIVVVLVALATYFAMGGWTAA
jgi:hypothetical protein